MKTQLLAGVASCLILYGCHKPTTTTTTEVTSNEVISDFVNKIALPQYCELQTRATALHAAVVALNTASSNTSLVAARGAWQDVRACWERCEGFLIGPVEDDNYDPNMDTWPVDYLQLDSFTAYNTSFSAAALQAQSQSLRGFHPLEFILWGRSGNVTVDSIFAKQKQYMVALSEDILQTVSGLSSSWAATGGNFQAQMLTAGSGSTRFVTRKDALLAIVAGMSDICDEVGSGKIYDPYNEYDSTKTESPFSHNSITDFINNITGAQSVYLCSAYGQKGASISALIAAKNLALDNKLKQQFTAAINSLGNVSVSLETAIYTQRTQLQNAMQAISDLQATLDGSAKPFIQTYITD